MSGSVPPSRDEKKAITIPEDDPALDLRLSLRCPGMENAPKRSWVCVHCGNNFSSPHALGGHLNGHKSERAKLASEKLLQMAMHKPLGIDRSAMVRKPLLPQIRNKVMFPRERHFMPGSFLYQLSRAQPWPSTAGLLQEFGIMNHSPSASSDGANRSDQGASKKDDGPAAATDGSSL